MTSMQIDVKGTAFYSTLAAEGASCTMALILEISGAPIMRIAQPSCIAQPAATYPDRSELTFRAAPPKEWMPRKGA